MTEALAWLNGFEEPEDRIINEFEKGIADGEKAIKNGLAEALGFGFGFPGNQGFPGTEQVSNVNTSFKNLRWWLVSNLRQFLNECYVEWGLVQTIIDVPVDDALRGGIEVKSQQLSEDQISDLMVSIDRDDDLNIIGQGAKWNRLFGGAGIVIMTDQDPMAPLNVAAINADSNLAFHAADMWELLGDQQNAEGMSLAISTKTTGMVHNDCYNYYGQQIHKSRVMLLKGLTAPSFIRPRLRGWGFSVVETLIRSINQYLKGTDLGFEVLDEFKVDVYKMKNLTNTLMSPAGENTVRRRIQLANFQKNYQNALIMDSEDDWDHKQLSFAGLGEAMANIRMQVASDMRMPLTKLFGISAAGFNSGEDDIEVYNAMVEGQVRNKIKYIVMQVCELKCQAMFGFVPDDLTIDFRPLRELSAVDEQTVKTQKFTRLMQAATAGAISTEEFRDACNKGDLFDITLDGNAELDGFNADEIKEGDSDKEPGADKLDTERATPTPKAKDAPEAKAKGKPASELPRAKTAVMLNSPEFDRASFEADGGEGIYSAARVKALTELKKYENGPLWEKAKEASKASYGALNWAFIMWYYSKLGGKL